MNVNRPGIQQAFTSRSGDAALIDLEKGSVGTAVFPLLADFAGYRPCDTDLLVDHAARSYWLDLFASHLPVQLDAAGSVGVPEAARLAAHEQFLGELRRLRAHPDHYGRLDILLLDELRQAVLGAHGIRDEFRLIKRRENEAALAMLGEWLARLDAVGHERRLEAIVRGMLAGNLFDMGVVDTAKLFAKGPMPFDHALAKVPQRPWLIDDLDQANRDWLDSPPRKAVVFADNAGGDAVLGMLPLVRELLKRDAEIIVTANRHPSWNDVTHDDLIELRARAAAIDSIFASPKLRLVHSGNAAPLIDLSRVSVELASAAVGSDLIVLIGMGRGIESNFSARFSCRAWKVAMIKDPQVAKTVGGAMYDAVFQGR